MYSYLGLVKRKRATLGSDPLRDNQMRLRRISVWGSHTVSPPPLLRYTDIQSYLLCLKNPRGLGTESPDTFAFFRSGKFHFTLNQDTIMLLIASRIISSGWDRLSIICLNILRSCIFGFILNDSVTSIFYYSFMQSNILYYIFHRNFNQESNVSINS